MNISSSVRYDFSEQRGAALVTTILVSLLLGTACVALLTAVGASSRNNTDALSEYKAYYAAENGLQATIDVLRNHKWENGAAIKYSDAVADDDLSHWLGSGPISVGPDGKYTIEVTDPDDSAGRAVYRTQATFEQETQGEYGATRVFPEGVTVSFNGQSSTTVFHPMDNTTPFGTFQIVRSESGPTQLPTPLKFRLDYVMIEPRAAVRTMRGTIAVNGTVTFQTPTTQPTYDLMGSTITLCSATTVAACTAAPVVSLPPAATTPQNSSVVYASLTKLEPYRLKIVATGYGPDGTSSKKQLEAIVQRNYFNDLGSAGAISMLGPNAYFQVGASAQMSISGGAYPSVTVFDPAGLQAVLGNHTNGTMLPRPEIQANDVPDWQQSPAALDALIQRLRQSAQNSGRYFNGTNPATFGNYAAGTGITFCEGSCGMSGNMEGGGVLVVTGTFTTSGNPRFRGLVLAVGRYVSAENPGGVVRSGGGNETFTGNIVIAPYNPANLLAGFERPRYDQTGGPGDTIQSEVALDEALDGTSAITDFILGVAEK